jgi:hypothetical protein
LWIGSLLLTISKLKRGSITYYIDTANTAQRASADFQRANGGLGEYYSERETRTPVWLLAGDTRTTAPPNTNTDHPPLRRRGAAMPPTPGSG